MQNGENVLGSATHDEKFDCGENCKFNIPRPLQLAARSERNTVGRCGLKVSTCQRMIITFIGRLNKARERPVSQVLIFMIAATRARDTNGE
jgi:hypothetical protein